MTSDNQQPMSVDEKKQPLVWIERTKCPACGETGLFVGKGGYITCSHLDCPEPVYDDAINQLIREAEQKAQLKIMGIVLREVGGKLTLHRKNMIFQSDKDVIEVTDDFVRDGRTYHLTSQKEKE